MKKLAPFLTLLAGTTLALPAPYFAHGGTYRGPGDTVPPGGSGRHGGGVAAPAPAGHSGPNRAGPTTPGSAAPGVPGGAGGPTTGGGADIGSDLTQWSFWWEFNKEPYLNLKAHIHDGGVQTGSDEFFLGDGQMDRARDTMRPSDPQIRQQVVPALLQALDKESNNDIVTGCLIALAKIGDTRSEGGSSEFEEVIKKRLNDPVQEIRETAAVALGILAMESSVPTLAALLEDREEGRRLVGKQEVSWRTRSFAAYGLGLVGARTTSPAVKTEIVRTLTRAVASDDTRSRDLQVSCIISLGLVPIEAIDYPPCPRGPEGEDAAIYTFAPESSRRAQLDYLLSFLQDDANEFLVRAHVPAALVRLLDGLPAEVHDAYKQRIAHDLIARVGKRGGDEREIVQSSVLALGLLADLDDDEVDRAIRAAIAAVPKEQSDQQARNFSVIAMAKAAGSAGNERSAEDGMKEAARFLSTQLSGGRSTVQPWAGLAIGVMANLLNREGVGSPVVNDNVRALRQALASERNTGRIGAYAIGCGIATDLEATAPLLEKLEHLKDDTARGYTALALGLMNAREAIEPIQRIVGESKYRPALLKQAAIALGLLGDKDLAEELVGMLRESKGLAAQAAISTALGFIGDARSIDPLVEMLRNEELTSVARGLAAAALGIVADKEPLPWNSKIALDLNYRASTTTLNEERGTGILNIL